MIKKSHRVFMVSVIVILTSISPCIAREKTDTAARSEDPGERSTAGQNQNLPASMESLEGTTLENYLQYAALHNPELEGAFKILGHNVRPSLGATGNLNGTIPDYARGIHEHLGWLTL